MLFAIRNITAAILLILVFTVSATYMLQADERRAIEMNTTSSKDVAIPLLDAAAPATTEIATFALG
jgi:hypothetical protein